MTISIVTIREALLDAAPNALSVLASPLPPEVTEVGDGGPPLRVRELTEDLPRLESGRGMVFFRESEKTLGRRVHEMFDSCLEEAESRLDLPGPLRATLVIADEDLTPAMLLGGRAPEWAAGLAVSRERLIVLDAEKLRPYPVGRLRATVLHEVCHLVLGRLAEEGGGGRVPLWLEEGVAQWIADEIVLGSEDQLEAALWIDALLPFHELETSFPRAQLDAQLAYRQSESFVRFLLSRLGRSKFLELVRRSPGIPDVYVAFDEVTGLALGDLTREWKTWLRHQSSPLAFFFRHFPIFAGAGFLVFLAFLRRKRKDRTLRDEWELWDPDDPPEGNVLER